ncbi:MAG TPA: DUF5995 family protein [Polyangiales bacterium]|nr:DUF5995 family protein [Polyangiales bacterium]
MTDTAQLIAAVSGGHSESYAEVLSRLDAIGAALDARDGLCWFNRLYRAMTEAVSKRASRGEFQDAAFLEGLDCGFADLYFSAIGAHLADGSEPRAWTPVFAARANRDIAPLQFAVAGMNAHINRDLVAALLTTFEKFGGEPVRGSARHNDYMLINAVLGDVHAQAKAFLFSDLLQDIDQHLGAVDDTAELWSLERARDAAWIGFEVQWQLRPLPWLAFGQFTTLDKLVGCTGRGLLKPLWRPTL